MAIINLSIKDSVSEETGESMVEIKMESEPAWPGPAAEDQSMTSAQALGLEFLELLTKHIGKKKKAENKINKTKKSKTVKSDD